MTDSSGNEGDVLLYGARQCRKCGMIYRDDIAHDCDPEPGAEETEESNVVPFPGDHAVVRFPLPRGFVSEEHEWRFYREVLATVSQYLEDPDRPLSVPGILGMLGILRNNIEFAWLNALAEEDEEYSE